MAHQHGTLLQRVQRCLHCAREMDVSSLSYAENPFCVSCLDERLGKRAERRFEVESGYVVFIAEETSEPHGQP